MAIAVAVFPPLLVYMTAGGESSGGVDVMLERASEYLEREFNTFTAVALSLLEPVIILIMGGLVTLIVLSILLAGTIAHGLWPQEHRQYSDANRRWLLRAVIGCLVAAAWTLGGYVLAWWQVTGSLTVAISNMPASLLTSAAGLPIALLLAPRLRKAMKR